VGSEARVIVTLRAEYGCEWFCSVGIGGRPVNGACILATYVATRRRHGGLLYGLCFAGNHVTVQVELRRDALQWVEAWTG